MNKKNVKTVKIIALALLLIGAVVLVNYLLLPVNRIGARSELKMLGDLNGDGKWDASDGERLEDILRNPYRHDPLLLVMVDVNKNQLIDEEDILILKRLYRCPDPYTAEHEAAESGMPFPRPRELFKYLPVYEYTQRPVVAVKNGAADGSPFRFIGRYYPKTAGTGYGDRLASEIYDEALRATLAYNLRKGSLTDIEKEYMKREITVCEELYRLNDNFNLLLTLVNISEYAETLNTKHQAGFIRNLVLFRGPPARASEIGGVRPIFRERSGSRRHHAKDRALSRKRPGHEYAPRNDGASPELPGARELR